MLSVISAAMILIDQYQITVIRFYIIHTDTFHFPEVVRIIYRHFRLGRRMTFFWALFGIFFRVFFPIGAFRTFRRLWAGLFLLWRLNSTSLRWKFIRTCLLYLLFCAADILHHRRYLRRDRPFWFCRRSHPRDQIQQWKQAQRDHQNHYHDDKLILYRQRSVKINGK